MSTESDVCIFYSLLTSNINPTVT